MPTQTEDEYLDEKGFVFLDERNRPYWCRLWCDHGWLFYWHPDRHWVSLRRVTQTDVWMFPRNLSPERQELYHRRHRQWETKTESTPSKLGKGDIT